MKKRNYILHKPKHADPSKELLSPINTGFLFAGIIAGIVFISTIATMVLSFRFFIYISNFAYKLYGSIGYQPLNYTLSFSGAIIGAAYSFIDTFIISYLIVWGYNKLID